MNRKYQDHDATATDTDREQRNSILFRAWERLQYPAGAETRARLRSAHANRRHGW